MRVCAAALAVALAAAFADRPPPGTPVVLPARLVAMAAAPEPPDSGAREVAPAALVAPNGPSSTERATERFDTKRHSRLEELADSFMSSGLASAGLLPSGAAVPTVQGLTVAVADGSLGDATDGDAAELDRSAQHRWSQLAAAAAPVPQSLPVSPSRGFPKYASHGGAPPELLYAARSVGEAHVPGRSSPAPEAYAPSEDAATEDAEVSVPTIRWQRGTLLGVGAFGKVFLGLDLDTGALLAVKQVTVSDGRIGEVRTMEKEIALLGGLRHENVVRYIGTQRDSEHLNIFLEYVPGGSIASLISKFGPLPEHLIGVYTRQILLGLNYLHSNDIVHLDIKGANILGTCAAVRTRARQCADRGRSRHRAVDNNGIIKLADFGASGRMAMTASLSLNALRGTPYWMAPEVIRQQGYGKPADIWSLGCTILEMATARPPWHQYKVGRTRADARLRWDRCSHGVRAYPMQDYVSAIFHIASARSPPDVPAALSQEARDFLGRCFQRKPGDRPTARQLLEHAFIVHAERCGMPAAVAVTADAPNRVRIVLLTLAAAAVLAAAAAAAHDRDRRVQQRAHVFRANCMSPPTPGSRTLAARRTASDASSAARGAANSTVPGLQIFSADVQPPAAPPSSASGMAVSSRIDAGESGPASAVQLQPDSPHQRSVGTQQQAQRPWSSPPQMDMDPTKPQHHQRPQWAAGRLEAETLQRREARLSQSDSRQAHELAAPSPTAYPQQQSQHRREPSDVGEAPSSALRTAPLLFVRKFRGDEATRQPAQHGDAARLTYASSTGAVNTVGGAGSARVSQTATGPRSGATGTIDGTLPMAASATRTATALMSPTSSTVSAHAAGAPVTAITRGAAAVAAATATTVGTVPAATEDGRIRYALRTPRRCTPSITHTHAHAHIRECDASPHTTMHGPLHAVSCRHAPIDVAACRRPTIEASTHRNSTVFPQLPVPDPLSGPAARRCHYKCSVPAPMVLRRHPPQRYCRPRRCRGHRRQRPWFSTSGTPPWPVAPRRSTDRRAHRRRGSALCCAMRRQALTMPTWCRVRDCAAAVADWLPCRPRPKRRSSRCSAYDDS